MGFDPVTMAIGMTIASAVAGAAGSIMSGMAAAQAGKANKAMMDQAAAQRATQGAIAAQRVRKQFDQLRGAQLAAYAGQGVDVFSESPMELLSESAKEYEWRANTAKWQGEAEAIELRNRGELQAWQGRMARNTAYAQAAAQLFKAGAGTYQLIGGGGGSGSYGSTVGSMAGSAFAGVSPNLAPAWPGV